jgi:ATP-dependent RNA helicase RhlE
LPRNIDPLKTTQFARLDLPNRKPVRTSGQPDPTRTSIDSLASGNRRRGGGGGGGGYGGGNGGGNRGFGGGGGGRGFGR